MKINGVPSLRFLPFLFALIWTQIHCVLFPADMHTTRFVLTDGLCSIVFFSSLTFYCTFIFREKLIIWWNHQYREKNGWHRCRLGKHDLNSSIKQVICGSEVHQAQSAVLTPRREKLYGPVKVWEEFTSLALCKSRQMFCNRHSRFLVLRPVELMQTRRRLIFHIFYILYIFVIFDEPFSHQRPWTDRSGTNSEIGRDTEQMAVAR